jgi:hypothetical protein
METALRYLDLNRKFLESLRILLVLALVGVLGLLIFRSLTAPRQVGQITSEAPHLTEPATPPGPAGSGPPGETPAGTLVGQPVETQPGQPEETVTQPAGQGLEIIGTYPAGSKVEIDLTGSLSLGLSQVTDPAAVQVDVTFTGPDGRIYLVPAFFDGNQAGGGDGDLWRVRFAPDSPGDWTFTARSSAANAGTIQGAFTVTAPEDCPGDSPGALPDFSCLGRLEYAGGHYLRFSNGEYWVKGGIDDPENFLGEAFGDWNAKKSAIDYLSSKGANSVYIVLNNIDGDNNDTWPWVGNTPAEAKANSNQFDGARLQLWEDFFTYVQDRGIVLHLVLNDDSAWSGYDHNLYYREMIARFGHHPALIWNIGEEADEIYSQSEQIALASQLQSLDPYNHPVTVHRKPTWPFLGNPNFDLTSIQPGNGAADFSTVNLGNLYRIVEQHRAGSLSSGHPIPVMIDETPRVTRVDPAVQLKMRSKVLYAVYLAGGNYEMHFFDNHGQGGTISIQDLGPLLEDMRAARQFIESLPFVEMQPCNQILSGPDRYCFGRPGIEYAVYSPGGSIELDLSGITGTFNVAWYNPRTGQTEGGAGMVTGGQRVSLSPPDNQDWVLHLGGLGYFNTVCRSSRMAAESQPGGRNPGAELDNLLFQVFVPAVLQCGS